MELTDTYWKKLWFVIIFLEVWSACLSVCFLSTDCLFMGCTSAPNVTGLDYIFAFFWKTFYFVKMSSYKCKKNHIVAALGILYNIWSFLIAVIRTRYTAVNVRYRLEMQVRSSWTSSVLQTNRNSNGCFLRVFTCLLKWLLEYWPGIIYFSYLSDFLWLFPFRFSNLCL